ncbi:hypothetical protein ACFXDJ_06670 [Streptomyces sp. NPDC059443]|uniref:hypothetical protein n=1 Tax=unclassified Streptomyces TaxID=2593676 RepID=UPI0036AA34AA
MRRHTAVILGQLSLDDVPLATGRRTLTAADRARVAELRSRRAAREWHRIAADFFRGIG